MADGLFKFAGCVESSSLRPGQSKAGFLADDPFEGQARAQGIAIRYPVAVPIRVFAIGAYLNSTIPAGFEVVFMLTKNNLATPVRIDLQPSTPFGGRTATFDPPVDFAPGDGLDLMVTILKRHGEPAPFEARCSATIAFHVGP